MSGNFYRPSDQLGNGNFGLIVTDGGPTPPPVEGLTMTVGSFFSNETVGYDSVLGFGALSPNTVDFLGGTISIFKAQNISNYEVTFKVEAPTLKSDVLISVAVDAIVFDLQLVYSADFDESTNDNLDPVIAEQVHAYLDSKKEQDVTVVIEEKA